MALEYREERSAPRESQPEVVMDRHLYLTEGKDRVVEENDPASRSLWCTPGMSVPLAEAERLGAVKANSEEEFVEAPKQRTPAQNKQRKPRTSNKSTQDETETPPAEEE